MALCAFMCDLMLERCPEETEDYELYCSEKDYASSIDKYCSACRWTKHNPFPNNKAHSLLSLLDIFPTL